LTFYGFVAGKSKKFAEVNVPASASDVGDLEKQFYSEFSVELAGIGLSQFHLELLPAGTIPDKVESAVNTGKTTKLEATAALAEAGITQGARIVAVLPALSTIPQEQSKTITIRSFQKGKYKDRDVTLHSQKALDKLFHRAYADGLVDPDDSSASPKLISEYEDLVSGKRYSFSGEEFFSAQAENKVWTQQEDRQLERDATAAVLREMEEDLGPLTEYTGDMELAIGTEKQAFGGIVLNSSAVLFVEAKHTASVDNHVPILNKKVSLWSGFSR
jgi:hypothetical protein